MSEVLYNFLKKNINKRLLFITKGGFRYVGTVLLVDKQTVEINDRKIGNMAISLDDILNVRRSRE